MPRRLLLLLRASLFIMKICREMNHASVKKGREEIAKFEIAGYIPAVAFGEASAVAKLAIC